MPSSKWQSFSQLLFFGAEMAALSTDAERARSWLLEGGGLAGGTGAASCSEPRSSVRAGGPLLPLSPENARQLLERDLWFSQTKVSVTDRQSVFAF